MKIISNDTWYHEIYIHIFLSLDNVNEKETINSDG